MMRVRIVFIMGVGLCLGSNGAWASGCPADSQRVVTGEFIGLEMTASDRTCRQGHWILAEGGTFDGIEKSITRTTVIVSGGTPTTSMRTSTKRTGTLKTLSFEGAQDGFTRLETIVIVSPGEKSSKKISETRTGTERLPGGGTLVGRTSIALRSGSKTKLTSSTTGTLKTSGFSGRFSRKETRVLDAAGAWKVQTNSEYRSGTEALPAGGVFLGKSAVRQDKTGTITATKIGTLKTPEYDGNYCSTDVRSIDGSGNTVRTGSESYGTSATCITGSTGTWTIAPDEKLQGGVTITRSADGGTSVSDTRTRIP